LNTRPTSVPVTSPTVIAKKRFLFQKATAMRRITGRTIIKRKGENPPVSTSPAPTALALRLPNTPNSTRQIPAAEREYLARLATTPATSAVPSFRRYRCVDDEIIVVSEIGARLSPNMAPEKIAPASRTGSAPRAAPAG